jgi:hypothetical protein
LFEIYVTIFAHHKLLIKYLESFGFTNFTYNIYTNEIVYVKSLEKYRTNLYQGYPILNMKEKNNYVLPIRPGYHTKLLPDAILKTEDKDIYILNSRAGNALKKVYFGKNLWAHSPRPGDIVFFYRTKNNDNPAPAHYQSVITSIGVVSSYGITNQLEEKELQKLLNKCVLEKEEIAAIKSPNSNYRYLEFIYFGKLDSRKINLAFMRNYKLEAPRGLDLLSANFADIILKESGYSEGLIVK